MKGRVLPKFNLDLYQCNITSTLCEAQLEYYQISKKLLIIQKIGTLCNIYVSLRSKTFI
jgi:hypothetical protein